MTDFHPLKQFPGFLKSAQIEKASFAVLGIEPEDNRYFVRSSSYRLNAS